jgi:hypothetical protein
MEIEPGLIGSNGSEALIVPHGWVDDRLVPHLVPVSHGTGIPSLVSLSAFAVDISDGPGELASRFATFGQPER